VNLEADQLREEIFGCEHCASMGAFARSPGNGRFYKFPPIIGAQGEAELLFVGINPRRDERNQELHDWVMSSQEAFANFAENRDQLRRSYIASDAKEKHYHCHMFVVEGVFRAGTTFEEKAAVTELFLCANESGSALLELGKSPCARHYLRRVLGIVKPIVVIAVGSGVQRHLHKHFCDDIRVPIVFMDHPRQLSGMSQRDRNRRLQETIDRVRDILGRSRCRI
jgi:uracil-DNA glycosylase